MGERTSEADEVDRRLIAHVQITVDAEDVLEQGDGLVHTPFVVREPSQSAETLAFHRPVRRGSRSSEVLLEQRARLLALAQLLAHPGEQPRRKEGVVLVTCGTREPRSVPEQRLRVREVTLVGQREAQYHFGDRSTPDVVQLPVQSKRFFRMTPGHARVTALARHLSRRHERLGALGTRALVPG